ALRDRRAFDDLEHERPDHRLGLDQGRAGQRQRDPLDLHLLDRLQLVPLRSFLGAVGHQLRGRPERERHLPVRPAPHLAERAAMSRVVATLPRPRSEPSSAATALVRARRLGAGALITAIGLAIFVGLAFPNLWLFLTSLKDDRAAWAIPPQYIPLNPTLEKYVVLFSGDAAA